MKRWAIRIAVFLLLGAIVNVAVAWGCAAWIPLAECSTGNLMRQARESEKEFWLQNAPRDFADRLRVSSQVSNRGVEVTYLSADRGLFLVEYDSAGLVTRINLAPARDASGFDHAMFVRSGWPCFALHGTRWISGFGQFGQFRVAYALVAPPQVGSATLVNAVPYVHPVDNRYHREFRILPTGLILSGFAINTLFYAAILWALFAVPAALRRKRRIKRGLCPKCAYPVGASPVCTECGAVVKPKAVQA